MDDICHGMLQPSRATLSSFSEMDPKSSNASTRGLTQEKLTVENEQLRSQVVPLAAFNLARRDC